MLFNYNRYKRSADTVGIVRKNDHDIVIIFRKERSIKTNHDIEKTKKKRYLMPPPML